jgi:hypothetical protein
MTEVQPSHRYCVVNCLGCRNPIPLFAEPLEDSAGSTADAGESLERPYFRAWCHACGREYPYLATARIWLYEPPVDKHQRQLEFPRTRQRDQARRAHA